MTTLIDKLPKVKSGYKQNYPLSKINWLQVGGNAEIFFKPKDEDELEYFLKNIPKEIEINVIGVGSNLIVRDGGVKGVVIRLGRGFSYINPLDNDSFLVGAATLDYNVANQSAQHKIEGFEFLSGIPGTIGGGIAMNAGAYGSDMANIVEEVHAFDFEGNKIIFDNQKLGFTYRSNSLTKAYIFTKILLKGKPIDDATIIINRIKEIQNKRELTQPIKYRTGGSTFRNPEEIQAWKLIDNVGGRGQKIGGAQFSEKHCNFLINLGKATAKDLETLGEDVRSKILEKHNIHLKWEIKFLGKK